jgi:alanyl aminopeptidase
MRLGRDVVPTFESVRLALDADKTDYTGVVHIDIEFKKPVAAFRLHAEEMQLGKIELRPRGKSPSKTPVTELTSEAGPNGLVTLRAGKTLSAGRYGLDIAFSNDFGTKAVGLYRMLQDGRGYLFTQFEADDAREAFPCFDEPGFKIPWQVTLDVPDKQLALTNTPIESQSTKDGVQTIVFEKTPPLPSYLLALACGPLETVDIPGLGVPGRIVTVAGQSRLAGLAVQMTPPLLAALERWFGQKYPFKKLDLIAIPNTGRAPWRIRARLPSRPTFSASIPRPRACRSGGPSHALPRTNWRTCGSEIW